MQDNSTKVMLSSKDSYWHFSCCLFHWVGCH